MINTQRIVTAFAIINFLGIAAINIPTPQFSRMSYRLDIPANKMVSLKPVVSSEVKCLQENIFFEARNQSIFGQLAVGIVTLERKNYGKFPDTICGVVFQKKQFSWANKGRKKPKLKNSIEREAWDTAGKLAESLYQADIDMPVFNVTYYHTKKVNPRWNRKLEVAMVIDDHVFYKSN